MARRTVYSALRARSMGKRSAKEMERRLWKQGRRAEVRPVKGGYAVYEDGMKSKRRA